MPKKLTAAEAIKTAQTRKRLSDLPPAAVAELADLCAYNDKQVSRDKRVGAQTAIKILHGHGWNGQSTRALDAACAQALGREGYAKP